MTLRHPVFDNETSKDGQQDDLDAWAGQYAKLTASAFISGGLSSGGKTYRQLVEVSAELDSAARRGKLEGISAEDLTKKIRDFLEEENAKHGTEIYSYKGVPVVFAERGLPVKDAVVVTKELIPADVPGVAVAGGIVKRKSSPVEKMKDVVLATWKATFSQKDVEEKEGSKFGKYTLWSGQYGNSEGYNLVLTKDGEIEYLNLGKIEIKKFEADTLLQWLGREKVENELAVGKHQEKIYRIVNSLREYLPTSILDFDFDGDGKIDSQLDQTTIAALSILAGENVLFIGTPGSGKTSLMKILLSIFNGLPPKLTSEALIYGGPTTSESDIKMGYVDQAKLIGEGKMEVIWKLGAFLGDVIGVDEINRLPPHMQSLLLEMTNNEGQRIYKGVAGPCEIEGAIATANFDSGVFEMIRPLSDRISTMIELTSAIERGKGYGEFVEYMQGDLKELSDSLIEKIKAWNASDESKRDYVLKEIKKLGKDVRKRILKKLGAGNGTLDIDGIRSEINKTGLAYETRGFQTYIISKWGFTNGTEASKQKRTKRGELAEALQFKYSKRFTIATENLAKAIAWYFGNREVNPKHMAIAVAYNMLGRVNVSALENRGYQAKGEPYYTKLMMKFVGGELKNIRQYYEPFKKIGEAIDAFENKGKKAKLQKLMSGNTLAPLPAVRAYLETVYSLDDTPLM